MLTNSSTSSTSVSSSSFVEVTSAPPASSSSAVTLPKSAPPPILLAPTPAKKKRKSPKANSDPVPAEVVSGGPGLSNTAPPEANNIGNDNPKKRSRKQKIDTLRDVNDVGELTPFAERQPVAKKSKKGKKDTAKATFDNNATAILTAIPPSTTTAKGKNANKDNVTKPKGRVSAGRVTKAKNKQTSGAASAVVAPETPSAGDQSEVYDPNQKIVLRQNEFIDPNLSFTIFPDLSRGLGAIGPSQVLISVESTREPGSCEEVVTAASKKSEKPIEFSFNLFSLFLSVPHYLPLTSVYSSGEPFARILRFSALEQYTNGVLGKNQVSTFRFYGPRYEKQVPHLSAKEEKHSEVIQVKRRLPKPNSYPQSVLIIKHPILGFYSRKSVILKFIVLKRVRITSTSSPQVVIVGQLKAKVVQLRRSVDLKNIEIYVDESRVPEAASDVNAMNQQNIQPVIQTPSGLLPVITRTAYQAPQDYNIEPQPVQTQADAFQYVNYHYQSPSELVQEISASGSNFILNVENSGEYFGSAPTFRDETGAQVYILSPSDDQSPASYIPHQESTTSFYTNQEQTVIFQQPPQFSASQQLQLQQQQHQAYTIQQQQEQQQTFQIETTKSGRQLIVIQGPTGPIPIEIQYSNPQASPQVVESTSARVYSQPAEQLQIQSQQQFRAGQQIVVQQPQNHLQTQQQVVSPQNQIVIRHQQQHVTQQSGPVQTYQFRNASPQNQQQVVIQQSQNSHVLQQHQVLSSCAQQAQHHPPQFTQIQQGAQSPQRYQSPQQTQPLQQSPLIPQQTTLALQSPPSSAPVPVIYQRPPLPQQVQPPPTQQSQFAPQLRAPPPPSISQSVPPSKQQSAPKAKQPKGSRKNSKDGVATNQPATNLIPDPVLTPQQLEALESRAQKSGYQPPSPAVPAASPYQAPFQPPGHIRPLTSPHQSTPLAHFTSSSSKKPAASRTRPPAPPPPIISSTASLAHLQAVSSGTTPAGQSVAPKSQVTFATTPTALPSSPALPVNKPKTLFVVSPPSLSKPGVGALVSAPQKHQYQTKPGHLAVCPHCGVGNKNILRCNRCKHELPADVKFIKDEWHVNKSEAALAVPASNTANTTATPRTAAIASSSESNAKTAVSATVKGGKVVTGRKIVLVNKPQPPTPVAQGVVAANKTIVAPGTVHVQIQPDGGSSVTVNSGGSVSVLQSKPAVASKNPPVPKKRAAPKKKQLELITLSSDEEEPEPPAKVAKKEEKPAAAEPATTSASSGKTNATNSASAAENKVVSAPSSSTKATASSSTGTLTAEVKKESNDTTKASDIKNEAKPSTGAGQTKDDDMPKKFSINLSKEPDLIKKEETSWVEPTTVYDQIEKEMGTIGNKIEYAMYTCRSVRIGSYKVTSHDTGTPISVTLTQKGLLFKLPCANYARKIMKLCIPMEAIVNMRVHFSRRLNVIFITTGPKYARFIRDELGMVGDTKNESSNYYCPLEGKPSQRTITMLGEDVEDSDIGIIKKMYTNVTEELDYQTANNMLMLVTPTSVQSSLQGFDNHSSASDTTTPKIVSTTSMASSAGTTPSPPDSVASSASTVIIPRAESAATPGVSGGTGGPTPDNNSDGAILFYEGRNNVKVSVSAIDIKCLGYANFLNDQIIDFWLTVIQTEILSDEDRNRTFVFDSFFYSKLTEKMKRRQEEDGNMTAGERRHSRVKKRTKNVDIFSKDFLIVPINENYHWFIAIICFPGMEGYHDYHSNDPIPNYKRPRTAPTKASSSATPNNNNKNKKPVVYNQPKNDTTASYSNRDEAPEDPDENDQVSSPDTPGTDGSESKSHEKTEAVVEPSAGEKSASTSTTSGVKRKAESGRAVKHPCILIFDSLAGEARGRIYSTLREYLRIEYKTKKHADRVFDKSTIPGIMPKVPQQPNFSDCGLFLLQYVESFFSDPIPNYETKSINLKNWFPPSSIAENKRKEIYNFIKEKTVHTYPQNVARIPDVSFEPDENDVHTEEEDEDMLRHAHGEDDEDEDYFDDEDFEDDDSSEDGELFTPVPNSKQPQQRRQPSKPTGSDNEDHNYATSPPRTNAAATLASTLPSVAVVITPLPTTSDTTSRKNT